MQKAKTISNQLECVWNLAGIYRREEKSSERQDLKRVGNRPSLLMRSLSFLCVAHTLGGDLQRIPDQDTTQP